MREEVGKDGGNNKGEDAERKEGEWQESTWESNRKYYKLYYNNVIFFVHVRGAVRALVLSCSGYRFVTFIILQ